MSTILALQSLAATNMAYDPCVSFASCVSNTSCDSSYSKPTPPKPTGP